MAPVVHVDKKFNISLKNMKDTLNIQPDEVVAPTNFFIPRNSAKKLSE